MTDKEAINQQEWADENNWRRGWLKTYNSRRDTRVLVPRQNQQTGSTFNFAHRASWWYLLGLSIVPLGFLLLFLLVLLTRLRG